MLKAIIKYITSFFNIRLFRAWIFFSLISTCYVEILLIHNRGYGLFTSEEFIKTIILKDAWANLFTYINIFEDILQLIFASMLAIIFLENSRISEHSRILKELKRDAFYNAFDIELPLNIQNSIRKQLFTEKKYRENYSLKYYFQETNTPNTLLVTAISDYSIVNTTPLSLEHKIERDVEKSHVNEFDVASLEINGETVEFKASPGKNQAHIRYTYNTVIPPKSQIRIRVQSTTLKRTQDSDALYCLVISDSMQVEVVFQTKKAFTCHFYSLCDNKNEFDKNNCRDTHTKNVFHWECPFPLLTYQGVKVEWYPEDE
jgi:hypothetical protein